MTDRRRLAPDLGFPHYAFVPGETPHPSRAGAQSHGLLELADEKTSILFGIDLFNHGYFWEAHEVWENPWRRAPAGSDRKLFLQGLIRLAAAALKLRSGSPAGLRAHAPWCAGVFRDLARRHERMENLALTDLAAYAGDLAAGNIRLKTSLNSPQTVLEREINPAEP